MKNKKNLSTKENISIEKHKSINKEKKQGLSSHNNKSIVNKNMSLESKETEEVLENSEGIRLNKFISGTGICSRREADRLIETGKVTINGSLAEKGTKVSEGDSIEVEGVPLKNKEKSVYIAFNKPTGITCTTESKIKDNIIDYINYPKRIFPIGRLDKASQGLIFLTNDGDIVNKILRAGNNHDKEYIVTVDKPITQEFIKKMANGVPILDTITKKCFVKKEDQFTFTIILTQGLNRQIRRMCKYLGYRVVKLKRVRIMNITLEGLPKGKWRYLTSKEMNELNKAISNSINTKEASLI
ncbi:23S rRNA pseudouridine(2604) synthase RluF [Clostridium grantii]|uniref:Pseudouridine synthase n=1 Tax=Clostridium grantii DSM 8605 TaxID=1121316 RepID=A0A1M5QJD8_9CLOT|nr:23S rRNA pseudouridine(2604) synthase RluF [Clostridium grantii]SHH13673.1 ribosomal large subunit pseudouridine synthase F [Clostridium grantii DSM 8605]